jgi:hypothetical protein
VPIDEFTQLLKTELPEAVVRLEVDHLICTVSAEQCIHFLKVSNQNFSQIIPEVDGMRLGEFLLLYTLFFCILHLPFALRLFLL